MTRWSARLALAVAAVSGAAATTACDTDDGRTLRSPAPELTTTTAPQSTVPATSGSLPPAVPFTMSLPWADGGSIPEQFTCDAGDGRPDFSWAGVPPATVEVAITVVDDDADGFVHWIATGIDPTATQLLAADEAPAEVENDFGTPAWGGPCPPEGDGPHTYRFAVHALGEPPVIEEGGSPRDAVTAIQTRAIATAQYSGVYER